jgi:hypothetical protein
MNTKIGVCTYLLALLASTPSALAQGRLFAGTDTDEFGGQCRGRLAWTDTVGPANGPINIIAVPYPVNGLTEAPGFLLAGQPETLPTTCDPAFLGNNLREIDYNGGLILQIPAGVPAFSPDCCNEQMVEFPAGVFYHAHFPDVIQRIRITGGPAKSEVVVTFPQDDVVGMTHVVDDPFFGTAIWISKWNGQTVGTWDPSTNTYTPVFNTPANAGGLAYDQVNNVLWVGLEGGLVIPYNTFGVQLGPGFQPFGAIPDTVDGLAFIPNPL